MTIGSSHQAGITRSNAGAFRRTTSNFRRTNSTTAERGFVLAQKARAMLGEAPAMESAQLSSGHPDIRSAGHFHALDLTQAQDDPMARWSDGRMIRWSDDPMTIGSSHQAGIKESNTSASRRTNSTTAEQGFMLATKARAILGEAPAMESAQLSSGHPIIRSFGHFHAGSLDAPMTRWPDGPMTIGRSHQAGIKRNNYSA
jgi:hypothetical protein